MHKSQKLRNLVTLFLHKVALGQKYVMPMSVNRFDKVGKKIYDSGYMREEILYSVKTEVHLGIITAIYLEELPLSEHRVSVTLSQFINKSEITVNHNIKDLEIRIDK